MGDPQGIGPEIIAKALDDPALRGLARFRVFGCARAMAAIYHLWNEVHRGRTRWADTPWRVVPHEQPVDPDADGPVVLDFPGWPFEAPAPSAEAGRASLAYLECAIEALTRPAHDPGRADALVTGPIAKEAWSAAGVNFPGHTELLAQRFNSPRSAMLFVGPRLRVILATIHVALRDVPGLLTIDRVRSCIELGHEACVALGVRSPRIAVAGLNPHAGENGLFGDEDAKAIGPAVSGARAVGLDVVGPLPGDTVFLAAAQGRFDLVVAMYHDQGLIPVKLLDQKQAVNVTVGLVHRPTRIERAAPIIRTSPAHGTAFDIAGKGLADPASMVEAIRLAIDMVAKRSESAGRVQGWPKP